jgi:hypothetical protein
MSVGLERGAQPVVQNEEGSTVADVERREKGQNREVRTEQRAVGNF